MQDFSVFTTIAGISKEGEAEDIEIKIGIPYKISHDDGLEEWACPVSLKPLYNKLIDAHGGTAFQALCLASSLVIDLLDSYIEKGGRLPDTPLESYCFGRAIRKI